MPHIQLDPIAILIRVSGIIALLSIPIKTLSLKFYAILPFNPYHLAHITALLVGLSLIYLASQLHRKKRTAYVATAAILSFLILLELLYGKHIHLLIFYAVTLLALFTQRKKYVVNNDITGLRRNFLLAGLLIVSVVAFAFVTFARIDQEYYGRDLTTSQTASITINAMLGEPLPKYVHPTRRDNELLFSLQAAFVISVIIIVAGLFYPVKLRRRPSSAVRNHARSLLVDYGNSSEDYLKIWPHDKHYYFYGDSFLAYGVSRGIALIIDGAAGNNRHYDKLRINFMEECRINGWQLTILHASESERLAWESLGFTNLYLGSEARVSIQDFNENYIRNKHFRYIKNKAEKDGLSVHEIATPFSAHDFGQLQKVSQSWLQSGRREYSFIMGYFNESYLNRCRIFGVYKNGEIVAYTNLLPTFQKYDFSIDHMRFKSDVSPAAMHYLLLNVLSTLGETDARTLNLGLSPLSKIEENTDSLPGNVLGIIRKLGGKYYSFAGLEQFKNKFGPVWEPTYLVYAGLPSRLPAIGAAVSAISGHKADDTVHSPWWLVAIATVAGVLYASFPIAIILNPTYAFHDFASKLGQVGQPYASLFNSMDVASSVLVGGLSLYLLIVSPQISKLLRFALIMLLVSALGDLVAAIFDLPEGFRVVYNLSLFTNTQVLLHAFASLINGAAYITAVIYWMRWGLQTYGKDKRYTLSVIILSLCAVGLFIGQQSLAVGGIIQRIFIVCYVLWLSWFIYDILQSQRKSSNLL